MKVYMVSGFGADYSVLSRLEFNPNIEVEFLDWLMPKKNESFQDYIVRMADRVDDSEDFYLLGYSFGGFVVQEIHKLKPAKKVVILASVKSHAEKPPIMKFGRKVGLLKHLPANFYGEKSIAAYSYFRKKMVSKNQNVLRYFMVRDAHYLKWSLDKIVTWDNDPHPEVIQILGDRDGIFPIQNSKPDFVIKGGSHLFPATKYKEVSEILKQIFI